MEESAGYEMSSNDEIESGGSGVSVRNSLDGM